MNENRMMNQVGAVFGIFMTLFYLGVGIYFITTDDLIIDRFVLGLFGFSFVLYGAYRGFRTWQKLRESFFTKEEEREDTEE